LLSEVSANEIIIMDSDASKVHTEPIPWAIVASVDSDTKITLVSPYNGASGSGSASKVSADVLIVGAGEESTTAATARGIFTATFDGTSWAWAENTDADVDAALIHDIIAVYSSLSATGTVYAASSETSQGSVFRSTDGGSTWEDLVIVGTGLPTDGWFTCVTVDTQDHSNLFTATGRPASTAYIYNSTDGGGTWSSYYTTLIDEAPATMLVDGLTVGFTTGLFSFTQDATAGGSGGDKDGGGNGSCFISTMKGM
jgi:hypothetical protein